VNRYDQTRGGTPSSCRSTGGDSAILEWEGREEIDWTDAHRNLKSRCFHIGRGKKSDRATTQEEENKKVCRTTKPGEKLSYGGRGLLLSSRSFSNCQEMALSKEGRKGVAGRLSSGEREPEGTRKSEGKKRQEVRISLRKRHRSVREKEEARLEKKIRSGSRLAAYIFSTSLFPKKMPFQKKSGKEGKKGKQDIEEERGGEKPA